MTEIKIENLEIFANHGVLKEENVLGQKFILSIELEVYSIMSDDINKTVNYAEVSAFAEKFLQERTYKLIETAANALAKQLVCSFDGAVSARVEIKKPWAPIRMNVEYVSAAVTASWHTAYIAVGSNLGDRRQHMAEAVEKINDNPFCYVTKKADIIETKPVGYTDQNDFLNGCIEIKTLFEPFELLEFLHEIEDGDGRTHDIHWGPRTIDLDIIFYDDIVLDTPSLTIPHKEMKKRYFVLKPLSDIAPKLRHSVTGETVSELLSAVLNDNR